ncbi:mycofactocin precursor MftA [Streptomyces sp. NPDC006450]|uniref:mycofactocin precursor MftA n=1 Tax=Streptomyces sp. NPDC006450 TaxID=3155458 RepID=UPI0033B4E918
MSEHSTTGAQPTATDTHPHVAIHAHADVHEDGGVEEELLLEEVSIDGMCGVY